jgi:hypothetical protein
MSESKDHMNEMWQPAPGAVMRQCLRLDCDAEFDLWHGPIAEGWLQSTVVIDGYLCPAHSHVWSQGTHLPRWVQADQNGRHRPVCACGLPLPIGVTRGQIGDAYVEHLLVVDRDGITGTVPAAPRTPRPMPGDAVRLATVWRVGGLEAGAVGVIEGMVSQYPENGHASIVFNATTFRDDRVVRCSGGPGTITTDLAELRPTGQATALRVRRWKHGHSAPHGGEDYMVTVPVWEWSPTT